jgi:hypothetical protein
MDCIISLHGKNNTWFYGRTKKCVRGNSNMGRCTGPTCILGLKILLESRMEMKKYKKKINREL